MRQHHDQKYLFIHVPHPQYKQAPKDVHGKVIRLSLISLSNVSILNNYYFLNFYYYFFSLVGLLKMVDKFSLSDLKGPAYDLNNSHNFIAILDKWYERSMGIKICQLKKGQ